MTRIILSIIGLAALLFVPKAYGFDLPFDINFQLGFNTQVVPGVKDTSRAHCLGVTIHKLLGDKTHTLVVSGAITNYGGAPCEGVEMLFAVTSYVGIGTSNARAEVKPDCIPPGGTATFTAFVSLQSEKPRLAMYTITAKSPPGCAREPAPEPSAPPAPGEPEEQPLQP